MKIEVHKRNVKESIDVIEECIDKGVVDRQRTIGFHVSAACIDLLEIYLHQENLIDPGLILKHEWFKGKRRLQERLPFDFPRKMEIVQIISYIEEQRNILCYGKPQKEESIGYILQEFHTLKKIFKELGIDAE